jgi:peptidoglycan/xylan/chitin deacetylase (PgdA/CDA1 family)
MSARATRRTGRRIAAAILVSLLAGALTACAIRPSDTAIGTWQPPAARPLPELSISSEAPTAPAWPYPGQRLRNDDVGVQARFALLPGTHPFNERVDGLVRTAIAQAETQSGVEYRPQVFAPGASLGERGCVAGSSRWPAEEFLANQLTGPVSGSGVAIACDAVASFGTVAGQTIRSVAGSAVGDVTSDTTITLFADVATRQVTEGRELWADGAAERIWLEMVERMRRDAGALSSAPLAPPNAVQLELVNAALEHPVVTADGGLGIVVPAGLTSPELAGLGIVPTAESVGVVVRGEVLAAVGSAVGLAFAGAAGEPFSGLPARPADGIDCALVPCVALTYDDGPTALTARLLDHLKERGAPATFFVLAGSARSRTGVVLRALDEGHEIATHTWSHPQLPKLTPEEVEEEVRGSAEAISAVTGRPVTMFRPPYGEWNQAVLDAAGLPAILWDVDTNDWRGRTVEELTATAVDDSRPGSIVLFHDTHEVSVDAAAGIVDGLRDRGFAIVTVTHLFGGEVPPGAHRAGSLIE